METFLSPTPDANKSILNSDQVQVLAPQTSAQSQSVNPTLQSSDRKFNLVIYGIGECPSGTNQSERVKYDLNSSASILKKLNSESILLQFKMVFDWANTNKINPALALFC